MNRMLLAAIALAIAAPAFAATKPAPASAAPLARAASAAADSAGASQGVYPDRIVFGRSGAMTGVDARKGIGADQAIRVLFKSVNAAGGVNGRMLELVTLDDGYVPARAAANSKILIDEKHVFADLLPNGTGTTNALLPYAEEAKVPVIGSTSGSIKPSPYYFPVRDRNYDDAKGITTWMSITGLDSAAVLYEDDAFGKAALADFQQAAKEDGRKVAAAIPFKADEKDGAAAVEALISQGGGAAKTIVLLTIDSPTIKLMQAIREKGLLQWLIAITSSGEIERNSGDAFHNVIVSQSHPALQDPSYPAITDFRELMKASAPDYVDSAAAFEGYMAARIAIDALKVAGKRVTRESFMAALSSFHYHNVGGLYYSYDTPEHVGCRYSELFMWEKTGLMKY